MSSYTIRPLTIGDAAEGAKLWHLVFGDDEALAGSFYRLFAHVPAFGACAEIDGTMAAAAYCPMGTDYIAPDGTASRGAYLYAVATHPDHRKQGLAKQLCQLLRDTAFAEGAELVFTKPSEESLYPWYQEKIGAVPLLGGQSVTFERTHGGTLPVKRLTAEEYANNRNALLMGTAHVRHSAAWLNWEALLHGAYGGGFYAMGNCIATLYRDGSTLQIGELLPRPTEEAVQSLLRALNAERCTCTFHGQGHYVSAAAKNGCPPSDNPWFGPCYG